MDDTFFKINMAINVAAFKNQLMVDINQFVAMLEGKDASMTRFEHLSNELIFEIFEFLDGCHIHKAFDNLNTRFDHLLTDCSFLLKLNLSSHKSTFEHYCHAVVTSNLHRISSLLLSNPLLIDRFLSIFIINSSFSQLKALTLNEIKSSNMIPLLSDLASLPCLVYLSITMANSLKFRDDIFGLIFRLPQLRYCRLAFELSTKRPCLRMAENVQSNLEHISIHGDCRLDDLSAILSYTPRLRRLSCRLYEDRNTLTEVPFIPINLTHVSFELFNISLQQFEHMIRQFSSQIRVLRIRSNQNYVCFNGVYWKQLISIHIPHLHTFDIRYQKSTNSGQHCNRDCRALVNSFSSPFWLEWQWSCTHQNHRDDVVNIIFYSIPHHYERKCDASHNCVPLKSDNDRRTCLDSIDQLGANILPTDDRYLEEYSQVTELIVLKDNSWAHQWYSGNRTHRILYRKQTKCYIKDKDIDIRMACSVLTSNITKVTIFSYATLNIIRKIACLCPRMEYLQIKENDYTEMIVKYMLKNYSNTCCFSICIQDGNSSTIKRLQNKLAHEQLLDDYVIGRFGANVYLWW